MTIRMIKKRRKKWETKTIGSLSAEITDLTPELKEEEEEEDSGRHVEAAGGNGTAAARLRIGST